MFEMQIYSNGKVYDKVKKMSIESLLDWWVDKYKYKWYLGACGVVILLNGENVTEQYADSL